MANSSKVSVAFSSDPSGLERGIQSANAAMRSLKASSSSLERQMESLKRAVSVNSMIQAFTSLSQVARSVATNFSGMWRNSAASIDQLAKLADASGRTFREMKALQLAGELSGTSVEALSKALAKADLAFFDASQGSASAVAAFRNIGLGVEQLAGLNSTQRFEKIAAAIGALPDPATRTAVAMRLLGKQGQELANFFEGGTTAIRDATAYVERMGLGLTEIETSNVEKMNDAFTKGTLLIGGIVDKITAGLSPAITKVVDKFGELVQKAGGAGGLGDAIVDSIFRGLELIAPTSDALVNSFRDMWSDARAMMDGVIDKLSLITSAMDKVQGATGLVGRSFENVGGFFSRIGNNFGQMNQNLKLSIAEAAGIDWLKQDALARLEQLNTELHFTEKQQASAREANVKNLALLFGEQENAIAGAANAGSSVMADAVRELKAMVLEARKEAEAVEVVNKKIATSDNFGSLFAEGAANVFRDVAGFFGDATEKAKSILGVVGDQSVKAIQAAGQESSLLVGSREANNYIARYLAGTGDPKDRVAKQQLDVQDRILKLLEGFGLDLGVVAIQK